MADYFADRPERPFAALPALTSNESQVTLIPIEDPPGLSEEELSELDKAQAAQASAVEEEKAIDFNPQEYLMENLEHYAIQPTLSGEDRYRYIFPLVGGTPLEITNHFLSPPDMAPLINIDAKSYARLHPKIDLTKVIYPVQGGESIEIPIPFFTTYTQEEKKRILQNKQQRGIGSGIVSFDWELDGTSVAEAKTLIKASLKIFLKSIAELDVVRTKDESGKHEVRYLDLIYRELKLNEDDTYNPNYFALKVSAGYRDNSSLSPKLRKAIERAQTTLYLSLNNHEIEFNDDGSVLLNITYFGYISSTLDAVNVFESGGVRQKNPFRSKYSMDMYGTIIKQMVEDTQAVYISTIKRIVERDENNVPLNVTYRSVQESAAGVPLALEHYADELASGAASSDVRNSITDLTMGEDGYSLTYFYFGDLLDTVLKSAYNNPENEAIRRVRFMVGPVILENNLLEKVAVNMCDVPISFDLYSIWFQEKIINSKQTEMTLMSFLKEMFDSLIKSAILSFYKGRSINTKVPSMTFSQFSLPELENGKDPVFGVSNGSFATSEAPYRFPRINHNFYEKKNIFKTKKYIDRPHNHYMFISSANDREVYREHGDQIPEVHDNADGIYYLSTGGQRGIVRSIAFKNKICHIKPWRM